MHYNIEKWNNIHTDIYNLPTLTIVHMKLKSPEEYGIVFKNNICLFQKSPLSQWYGAFPGQEGAFYPIIDGQSTGFLCNCAEQWMMLAKAAIFDDKETFDLISAAQHPKDQKDLGRRIKNFDAATWDAQKYKAVLQGNIWKFQQNFHLQQFLLQFPADTVFAEAAPWDTVWGIGLGPDDADALDSTKWRGENLLGKVISEVRSTL